MVWQVKLKELSERCIYALAQHRRDPSQSLTPLKKRLSKHNRSNHSTNPFSLANMLFATTAVLLLSSVCSAAVLSRQNSTASTQNTTSISSQSPNFIVHSKPCGASNFDGSFGYLHAEYSYPPGYSATLHTAKEDAITGYISDVNDPSNSTLVFPGSSGFDQGFKLYPLSEQYPNSLAQIFSGQVGTTGMAIVDGLLKWEAPDEVPVYWVGKFDAWPVLCSRSRTDNSVSSLPQLGA